MPTLSVKPAFAGTYWFSISYIWTAKLLWASKEARLKVSAHSGERASATSGLQRPVKGGDEGQRTPHDLDRPVDLAALKERDIAARGQGNTAGLSEPEIHRMMQGMIKQRRELIGLYEQGNRADLAQQEREEMRSSKVFCRTSSTRGRSRPQPRPRSRDRSRRRQGCWKSDGGTA